MQRGKRAHILGQPVIDCESHGDPGYRQGGQYRHHNQLERLSIDDYHRAGLAAFLCGSNQIGKRKRLARLIGPQRIRQQIVVQSYQHHHAGIDARPMISQHRYDGAHIAGGDCLAKSKIGGEHGCRLRQLPAVLLDQPFEHPFSDLELIRDFCLCNVLVGGADQKKSRDLYRRQKNDKKNDNT